MGQHSKGRQGGDLSVVRTRRLVELLCEPVPEISDSIFEIDRAMRLGFNWELGPFELWDAVGVESTLARMKKEGKPVAANVEKLLASGQKSWYADDSKTSVGTHLIGTSDGQLCSR